MSSNQCPGAPKKAPRPATLTYSPGTAARQLNMADVVDSPRVSTTPIPAGLQTPPARIRPSCPNAPSRENPTGFSA